MDIALVRLSRIRRQCLAFIPAMYFMLLGLLAMVMDLWHNALNWFFFLFYAAFLIPVIFRRRAVYLVCGACFSILWLYLMLTGLFVMPGNTGITTWQAIGVEAWLIFSFLCSISMWYAGRTMSL